jgi:hypothetical protein
LSIVVAAMAAEPLVRPLAAQDPMDLRVAASVMAAARRLGEADAGRLWGRPVHGPLLLADPSTRAVVANMADVAGQLHPQGGLFVGTLPPEVGIANTATEWAGRRWTMVMWPLPATRYERDRLLAHEMYHRIQDSLGLAPTEWSNGHLETQGGRAWLRLEWRALTEALVRRDAERRQALEDALAFRRYRRSLFPDAARAERALELNEGLAEYTGFALSGLPAHVLAGRVAVHLATYDGRPTFVRNFAYASGPAYGVLLDEAGERWRRGLTPEHDLGELAARAYGLRPRADSLPALLRRAERYEGALVLADETARAERRASRLAHHRRRFLDGPTLTISFDDQTSFTFDPNGVEALDDVGTVYAGARVTGPWGVLQARGGGVLMAREGGRFVRVVVPVPAGAAEPPLRGDGWTLELASGWRVEPAERAGSWRVVR